MDQRQRLTRLIELTPPGARRDQYVHELQCLTQPIHSNLLPTAPQLDSASEQTGPLQELGQLKTQQALLDARLNQGLAFLNDLLARTGQDTATFDHYLREWQQIYRTFNRVCDQIDYTELNLILRKENLSHAQTSAAVGALEKPDLGSSRDSDDDLAHPASGPGTTPRTTACARRRVRITT